MIKDEVISELENYIKVLERCVIKANERIQKDDDKYFRGVRDVYIDEIEDLMRLIKKAKGEA